MQPTVAELAENAIALRLATAGLRDRSSADELVFEVGRHQATVQRLRLGDVEAAVAWARGECARRGLDPVRMVGRLECDARPTSPSGLSALGLVPDDEEATLTAMSTDREPPSATARRRAADRDDRGAARGGRGRLGRVEPARDGSCDAAGVRSESASTRTATCTTSPLTRTASPSASAVRST